MLDGERDRPGQVLSVVICFANAMRCPSQLEMACTRLSDARTNERLGGQLQSQRFNLLSAARAGGAKPQFCQLLAAAGFPTSY